MGNCVFKGFGEVEDMVKVVTSNGGVMELYAPITAECITNEFPGHGIFRSRDDQDPLLLSPPLHHKEELRAGKLYYLLPLNNNSSTSNITTNNHVRQQQEEYLLEDSAARSCSSKLSSTSQQSTGAAAATTYRMSLDNHGKVSKRSSEGAEVFPRYNSSGVWKVRLVINPEQLSEILSQEARTEALIESVRTVAKNGTTTTCTTSGVSSIDRSQFMR
ncbi:unnamed protein product [Coffea canephora]|uniref:Uncharacterized protein n=1 Tax=Coffea canephora TaxID=49390 RepID=A0A068UJI2_COFCA|nr:unnamed protein product [Coffea canephora]